MSAPQITMITLYAIGLGVAFAQHGSPKSGTENFWITAAATGVAIGILWWGGFWA